MEDQAFKNRKVDAVLSWTALALLTVFLFLLAWFIPVDRKVFWSAYIDFHAELPSRTLIAFYPPDIAFPIAAGCLALVALWAQLGLGDKSRAALLHLIMIAGCGIFFALYREAIAAPFFEIMRVIVAPPGP